MNRADVVEIEQIIKEYIKDNLRIETEEKSDNLSNTKFVKIKILLDDEVISTDTIYLSNDGY